MDSAVESSRAQAAAGYSAIVKASSLQSLCVYVCVALWSFVVVSPAFRVGFLIAHGALRSSQAGVLLVSKTRFAITNEGVSSCSLVQHIP